MQSYCDWRCDCGAKSDATVMRAIAIARRYVAKSNAIAMRIAMRL
jgi:stage V sporulation protein SpoVS